ncbi:MAG: aminotransferase class I/II-fold pyridoxal phosphate-dependent enzyme [Prevotella sp.]|nr:aminotransferase class I/II-fold pyridoxal phosphate-dependent enzyme [Prevotella sp.]
MIKGHGDDAYNYKGITSDFSSNICMPAHHHEALMAHLAGHPELIGHYPEPEAWTLEAMLAKRHGIDPHCVIVTNGATEAIYLIAQTFQFKPVIPSPTFSEYQDACSCFEEKEDKTALWLCNPNNPDGKVYDEQFIKRMTAKHHLVVLDHSYEQYTDSTLMAPEWGCQTDRIIQIHSFTKTYAIPGLRLGYITAHESLTQKMRCFLRPWNVSAIAIEAGKFLLGHDELMCRPDLAEAQRLKQQLLAAGIEVTPTHTNFMLCRIEGHTAADLKEYLAAEYGMLIRDASNFQDLTPQHFRIAAQTPTENDALVAAIRQYILESSVNRKSVNRKS